MNKDYIKYTIEEKLNNSAVVTFVEVSKNGVIKNGIKFQRSDSQIAPVVYYDSNDSDDEIINHVIDCFIESGDPGVNIDELNSNLSNWDWAKSRVYPRLFNTDKNHTNEIVDYALAGDVGVCFYICIDDDRTMSTKVLQYMLDVWNITIDDLKKAAKENLNKELVFDGMFNVMFSEPNKKRIIDMSDNMTVGTMLNKSFGASAILLLADLINNGEIDNRDYYILPSSIHETILLKEFDEAFKTMVKEVNSTVVNPEEFLSDNVFKYNASTQEIEVI